MHRILRLVCVLTAVVPAASSLLPAQETGPTAASKACSAPEHRQFDFWIGEWEVSRPNGAPAGRNRIESILDGCALSESWTGAKGSAGNSYNAYDRQTGRWHQTWVDNGGLVLLLDGVFADGKMVLSGETRDSSGARVVNRITWQETAPGAVRQLWETSRDGGRTWSVAFDGRYRRR